MTVYLIPDLVDERRRAVLRHEIFHGMGFLHHTHVRTSSLHSPARVTEFSREDRFALETHYDPRVQPGMHRDSVHAALGWD